ncbi:MAG: FAD-dependent thymidylate synthase [Bacteroidales bacterium]|jgi:thymidylate synthase (FAD)|nr:FAD-dependent thymidylate synthase [Bacteroidales bacterium]
MKLVDSYVSIPQIDGIQMMKAIEKACRTCYRSEGSITDDSYKTLLKNCITRGHESVLEHEKVTVQIMCDIGAYKDLTRHRIASFSIESTRYCCYDKDKFDGEISYIVPVFYDDGYVSKDGSIEYQNTDQQKTFEWRECMSAIEKSYMKMREMGATPDECRMLLPHSTAALVTMTANIREWKHIFQLRCNSHVHPSIQKFMIPLLLHFKKLMPEIYDDVQYNEDFPKEKYAEIKIG